MDEQIHVGERIAYYRRRRGLTQVVLSGLVGRSPSWLVKIESGDRTVEAIKDLFALARVLKVEPGDLIGGLRLPPNGGAPHDHPRGIPAIRREVLAVPPVDREPPDAAELRAGVEQARQLNWDGHYEQVALVLPELIVSGRAAVAGEVPGAWWCLAGAYQEASGLARTFGEAALACVAADRADTAAQRSGDALLVAVSRLRKAMALLAEGWLDEAGAVCADTADAIAPTDATSGEGWSVWGAVQFVAASVAVRGGDGTSAWRLLHHARGAGDCVGPGRNDYWLAFGPASVAANEVATALETGDAVEALRIADTVEVDDMPTRWRRARFLIDVAHAYVLRRDDGAAVAVLLDAERHAPEVVRYSVQAHEIVRVCLRRERRSRTPGLRGLAQRLAVAD